jgi:restriction system protein
MLIAAGVAAAARLVVPDVYAFFTALPFIVIGSVAAWRQLRAPGAARIARLLDGARAMSWGEFSGTLAEAFRRDGYAVVERSGAADLELVKAGRLSLVGCKRWKAARAGVDPLRDLYDARCAREAQECIYIASGEITNGGRAFAKEKGIRLIQGAELATLLSRGRRD